MRIVTALPSCCTASYRHLRIARSAAGRCRRFLFFSVSFFSPHFFSRFFFRISSTAAVRRKWRQNHRLVRCAAGETARNSWSRDQKQLVTARASRCPAMRLLPLAAIRGSGGSRIRRRRDRDCVAVTKSRRLLRRHQIGGDGERRATGVRGDGGIARGRRLVASYCVLLRLIASYCVLLRLSRGGRNRISPSLSTR